MISLVICSITPSKFQAVQETFRVALGNESWELYGVHDARSSAEAYNRAIPHLKGDIIIFCHDDIEILSPDLPLRLKEHLSRFDIIGVAGASRLVKPSWVSAGPPHIFGQIAHPIPAGVMVEIFCAPRPVVGNIQALDGVFLAVRRGVLDRVRFDEATFDGFHLYDLDFCLTAYSMGMQLGVANDINLLHQSKGNYQGVWEEPARRFSKKWADHLGNHIPPPPFRWSIIQVESRQKAAELMNPPYWRET